MRLDYLIKRIKEYAERLEANTDSEVLTPNHYAAMANAVTIRDDIREVIDIINVDIERMRARAMEDCEGEE